MCLSLSLLLVRWSTAVATLRSGSTAWTCLPLRAVTRTWAWWRWVTLYRPVPWPRSNCTATCSCSEPAWTWSSSSWTPGKNTEQLNNNNCCFSQFTCQLFTQLVVFFLKWLKIIWKSQNKVLKYLVLTTSKRYFVCCHRGFWIKINK